MREYLTWRRVATAALIGLVVVCVFYADLIASAFARNPYPQSGASVARGKPLFEKYCVPCHGLAGHGDGPAAAGLPSRMDDLASIAPPPIFPDGVVAYRIANGVDVMPAWKAVLTEGNIWDLVNYIRSLHRSEHGPR